VASANAPRAATFLPIDWFQIRHDKLDALRNLVDES
jgi:hypothetical protein